MRRAGRWGTALAALTVVVAVVTTAPTEAAWTGPGPRRPRLRHRHLGR